MLRAPSPADFILAGCEAGALHAEWDFGPPTVTWTPAPGWSATVRLSAPTVPGYLVVINAGALDGTGPVFASMTEAVRYAQTMWRASAAG